MSDGPPMLGAAVDNDVLLKAACFGLVERFWTSGRGVLGSARFVLAHAIERGGRVAGKQAAQRALAEALERSVVLEPSEAELAVAGALEELAQRTGLELDVGESQLAAIVVSRAIPYLDTGDKRAVRGFELLFRRSPTCSELAGRLRSLELLLLATLADTPEALEEIARAVCAEPALDKTASICFSCSSGVPPRHEDVLAGLQSYLDALRREAETVLAQPPTGS